MTLVENQISTEKSKPDLKTIPSDIDGLFTAMGICDLCSLPATTVLHSAKGTERFCEKHWLERQSNLVRTVVCLDCE